MKIPLQIRFGDIDRLGHVNNAIYAQFFDIGRVMFLQKCIPEMGFFDTTLVLVHLETDFVKPIFEKDSVYVETQIGKVGERSVEMVQEIKDDKDQVRSRCRGILSTLDMKTGHSFPMPDEWRKQLAVK